MSKLKLQEVSAFSKASIADKWLKQDSNEGLSLPKLTTSSLFAVKSNSHI